MRIEQLGKTKQERFVGIVEFQNSKGLNQTQLIRLATSLSSDVLTVQLLNGTLITSEMHLLSATENAINAQNGEYMLSRSLDVEILVFASAQRQISKAIEELGVHDGLDEIAAVVVGLDIKSIEATVRKLNDMIGEEILPAFPPTKKRLERIRGHYQISDKEIAAFTDSNEIESQLSALTRCIVSRVSLVALES